MASHPNGVSVGDLTVLIVQEERRGGRALLLAGLFQSHEGHDKRVVVRRGPTTLAVRDFHSEREARRVRDRFVEEAEQSSGSTTDATSGQWQAMLDRL